MLKQTSIISHDFLMNQYSTFDFKVT